MKPALVAMLSLVLLIPATLADEKPETGNDERKLGYSVGYQVGGDITRQGLSVDPEMVIRGVLDALAGSEPLMTEDEMKRALVKLQHEATAAAQESRENPPPQSTDTDTQSPDEK
jgi:FKBP-type peptidyl-prolyl cis-trans isomerase FklB